MQLNSKTLILEKEKRFNEQQGICPICGNPLDPDYRKNHLDHDHALTGTNAGRVRGLLCHNCNVTEGVVKHKFERSGLKSKIEYIKWLESLLIYLKKDYSNSCYHPQFITDTCKKFTRLNLDEMKKEMDIREFSYDERDGKKDLVKKFKSQFRKAQNCKS